MFGRGPHAQRIVSGAVLASALAIAAGCTTPGQSTSTLPNPNVNGEYVRFGRTGLLADATTTRPGAAVDVSDEPHLFEEIEVRELAANDVCSDGIPRTFLLVARRAGRGMPRDRAGWPQAIGYVGSCVTDRARIEIHARDRETTPECFLAPDEDPCTIVGRYVRAPSTEPSPPRWSWQPNLLLVLGEENRAPAELLLAPRDIEAPLALARRDDLEPGDPLEWILTENGAPEIDSPTLRFRLHRSGGRPLPPGRVLSRSPVRGPFLGRDTRWSVLRRDDGSLALHRSQRVAGQWLDITAECRGIGPNENRLLPCDAQDLDRLRNARIRQFPDRRYQLRLQLGPVVETNEGTAGLRIGVGLPIYRLFGGGLESGFIASFSRLEDDTTFWQLGVRFDYDLSYLWREEVAGRNRALQVAVGIDVTLALPVLQTSIGSGLNAGLGLSPFVDVRWFIGPQGFLAVTLAPTWVFARTPFVLASAMLGGGVTWQ